MNLCHRFSVLGLCLSFGLMPLAVGAQPTQVESVQRMKVYPLPGQVDALPMLNSNSPEIVQTPGILVSTLPDNDRSPFLNYAFKGDFGVFSHHIAKDQAPGERLLYIGLLASNLTNQAIKLDFKSGASYLSQPDALFNPLPSFALNPLAQIYAGPGDRVTTELLAGRSPLPPSVVEIPPHSTQIVYSLPVTTDVKILPPINGRSTLMYFHSDGPLYLSEIAWQAEKQGGQFIQPTVDDYRQVLNQRQLAGPREQAPPEYDSEAKPSGSGFRYGRVAGVSEGLHWKGELFKKDLVIRRPEPGEKIAYPLSSVYLKRWGTTQNQSAKMLRRYPDTAYQAHGNYGLKYELQIPLHNRSSNFQTYSLGLSHPVSMTGSASEAEFTYLYPPNKPVMFRGSVRLEWTDEYNQHQDNLVHLVLRHGEETPPLSLITVPPRTDYNLKLSLYYPADSTPPQLLTVGRIE